MYGWIWRRLPFGRPGKLIGSLLLATLAGVLLWYVVFPWAEPLLPFDDVQVTDDSGVPSSDEDGTPPREQPTPSATPRPGDGHDLPYDTSENNPPPSATPSR